MSSNVFTSSGAMPVAVADDQGTASPVANPPLHINPYDAAKKIRYYVKELKNLVGHGDVAPNITSLRKRIADAKTYNDRSKTRMAELNSLLVNDVPGVLHDLRKAIESRRASEGREVLMRLSSMMSVINDHDYRVRNSILRADSSLIHAIDGAKAFEPTGGGTKEEIVKVCDEIHKLAQALPSIPNAPMAPADNILRAMASVLKNGGYLESSSEFIKVAQQPDPSVEKEFGDEDVEVEYNEEDENAEEV